MEGAAAGTSSTHVADNVRPFALWAKMPTGQMFRVELSPVAPNGEGPRGALTTVAEVKECVAKLAGREPDEVRLIFAGECLKDGQTLDLYGVGNDSTLYVFVRLPGKLFFPLAPLPNPATDQTTPWLEAAHALSTPGIRTPYLSSSSSSSSCTSRQSTNSVWWN
jgi:hypothetical protein